jgi:hypothetical protein
MILHSSLLSQEIDKGDSGSSALFLLIIEGGTRLSKLSCYITDTTIGRGTRMDSSMKEKFKKIIQLYDEMIRLPHKTEIARELRDEDDLFLLLLYSDMLGLPNPVFYYTLELYPYIIEKFHDWHLRMGMEHSPLEGIRCC